MCIYSYRRQTALPTQCPLFFQSLFTLNLLLSLFCSHHKWTKMRFIEHEKEQTQNYAVFLADDEKTTRREKNRQRNGAIPWKTGKHRYLLTLHINRFSILFSRLQSSHYTRFTSLFRFWFKPATCTFWASSRYIIISSSNHQVLWLSNLHSSLKRIVYFAVCFAAIYIFCFFNFLFSSKVSMHK